MKSGIKVRLISKDVYNSDENYIVIMEINENGISRNINLMVKGKKEIPENTRLFCMIEGTDGAFELEEDEFI